MYIDDTKYRTGLGSTDTLWIELRLRWDGWNQGQAYDFLYSSFRLGRSLIPLAILIHFSGLFVYLSLHCCLNASKAKIYIFSLYTFRSVIEIFVTAG
jgi:hypothetical protein